MNKLYTLTLSVALLSLVSCSTFYQSSPTPTPILKQKGDVNLFISLNDAQVAYTLTDNIGLVATGHLNKRKQSFFSDTAGVVAKMLDNAYEDIEAKGYLSYQLGGFYLQQLDKTKSLQAGLLAGYYQPALLIEVNRGLFKKNTIENLAYKCFKTDVFVNYVHASKYIDFITSVKLVGLRYNERMYSEPLVMKELDKMLTDAHPELKSTYYFIEPSVAVQYGFANFKFRMQAFMSQSLGNYKFSKSQMGISWGLNYQFATLKPKPIVKKKMDKRV